MSIDEADRLEMHVALRRVLGDRAGDLLMEHLPPAGWNDVARRSETTEQFARIDERFDIINERFKRVDERFDIVNERLNLLEREIRSLRSSFRWMTGTVVSVGIANIALLLQMNAQLLSLL